MAYPNYYTCFTVYSKETSEHGGSLPHAVGAKTASEAKEIFSKYLASVKPKQAPGFASPSRIIVKNPGLICQNRGML